MKNKGPSPRSEKKIIFSSSLEDHKLREMIWKSPIYPKENFSTYFPLNGCILSRMNSGFIEKMKIGATISFT